MTSEPLSRLASVLWLVGLLVLCFGVAAVGGLSTTEGVTTWYPTLDKPPWTPPNWAFGPVWTVLYTAMAVAAWDVARRGLREARVALVLFAVQLALNAAWSPVFFAWQQVALALAIITAMWLAIAACIVVFWRRSRIAAALMVLYLAWVSIAWTLNAWILAFNPSG